MPGNNTPQPRPRSLPWPLLLTALTIATFALQGYHPYAEDGGMYLDRVLVTLHPTLFAQNVAFVREPLRISVFSPFIAGLVHLTHLPLEVVLLALDLAGIALTLIAALAILRRCTTNATAQFAGLSLFAAWSAMPVAATSLMLMDPNVTARTFSTPLTLFAIAFALDWSEQSTHRTALKTLAALLLAAAFHPLMAAYAAVLVATIVFAKRRKLPALLFALILIAAALTQFLAVPATPASLAADHTRYYWFLAQWHWYELFGLAAPLAIFAALLRGRALTPEARTLLRASIAFALLGFTVALLFAHEGYRAHPIARLQPLRVFCFVYALLPLLLGATVARFTSHRASRALRAAPALIIVASAITFFFANRAAYPASPHIELPHRTNPNPWVRAFLWVRDNTPPDALFAIDARYVNTAGEDAQNFRALTLRNVLPDYSKDGGEAANMPALAPAWLAASSVQLNLNTQSEPQRDARLRTLGATWIVLDADTSTAHACPYANGTIKVCLLTP